MKLFVANVFSFLAIIYLARAIRDLGHIAAELWKMRGSRNA